MDLDRLNGALAGEDPSVLVRARDLFVKAIEASTSYAPMAGGLTGAEVKRRFEVALRIFVILRRDEKWSMTRIEEHLPRYLRADLLGEGWAPDKRAFWMPGDGLAGSC